MTGSPTADAGWPELLGALAHEMRTPLATASMVLQLCNMTATDEGEVTLDQELVGMLQQSITTLVEMTDGLQDAARLARGRLALQPEPVVLADALAGAFGNTTGLTVETNAVPQVEGRWDMTHLPRALTDLARAVNRAGTNDGHVAVTASTPGPVEIRLRSGILRGDETAADAPGGISNAATLGVGFFFARMAIQSMGGEVTFRRGDQRCEICVALPAMTE